jgi:hypothetical protein
MRETAGESQKAEKLSLLCQLAVDSAQSDLSMEEGNGPAPAWRQLRL